MSKPLFFVLFSFVLVFAAAVLAEEPAPSGRTTRQLLLSAYPAYSAAYVPAYYPSYGYQIIGKREAAAGEPEHSRKKRQIFYGAYPSYGYGLSYAYPSYGLDYGLLYGKK